MLATAMKDTCVLSVGATPSELAREKRWSPWKAIWSDKRKKFDKVPTSLDGRGLSTAKPEYWYTLEAALAAYHGNRVRFAGVGFVLTGASDIIGVDLDHCVVGGVIAPWALAVMAQLATYAEFSPSATGVRMFALGHLDADWTNHTVGIEVYSGNEPRFLTITGNQVPGTPPYMSRPDVTVLDALTAQYAKPRSTAQVIDLGVPEVLDELALPDLASITQPPAVRDFMTEGKCDRDRSSVVARAAIELYAQGLNDAEVLSLLVNNQYVMEVALDHRRQDPDAAMLYLWRWHCVVGKPKAGNKVLTASDFDDVSEPTITQQPEAAAAQPPKRERFEFLKASDYVKGKQLSWLVKRVIPRAEVGVVYGASKAGKSFFVMDLCMAIVLGHDWRGHKVKKGRVAYICAEGASGFKLRLLAQAEYAGVDIADIDNFMVLGDGPNLLEKADISDLLKQLSKIPDLQLIVIDTMAQVTPGANENSAEDMGRALAHCKVLHKKTDATVCLIGHSGKDATKGIRGWSGILGALDFEICVSREGDVRQAEVTKMKDGPGEGDIYGFALEVQNLGLDEDGDMVTTCIVRESDQVASKKGTRDSPREGRNITAVRRALAALTEPPTEELLVAAAVSQMTAPPDGKKDLRRDGARNAVREMIKDKRLILEDGRIKL